MPVMLGIPHPYMTPSLPGIGGVIKYCPEDFVVEEVPLYTPCGEGEHTYFEVEKTDLSTPEALERLSKELGVGSGDFGYAGLKDRKGVTRQVFSIAHQDPERVARLDLPQMKVLWARLHRNKLRIGHLKGNRFLIRIRSVAPGSEKKVEEVLGALEERGVPNYYGPQRFGNRGDAQRVGRAFLKHDDAGALRRILGYPSETEHNPNVVEARNQFMAGNWDAALQHFPGSYREERRVLRYLLQAGENYAGARRKLSEGTKKLYFTAYQAYLFNLALAERLLRTEGDLRTLFPGDIAFLHRNGALFGVKDPLKENERAIVHEISASGPIFGKSMPVPDGMEAEIEREILAREGIVATDFHQLMPKLHLEGGRRPFRVRVEVFSSRIESSDLVLSFFLPKGSYATTLLRELMKNDVVPEGFYEDGEEGKHRLWRPAARSAVSLESTPQELELGPEDGAA